MNDIWYFAGGVVNVDMDGINDAKWLRVSPEQSDTLNKEFINFKNSNDITSFLILNGQNFILVKVKGRIQAYKLIGKYARRVIHIPSALGNELGHSPEKIKNILPTFGRHFITFEKFSEYFKIKLKIV